MAQMDRKNEKKNSCSNELFPQKNYHWTLQSLNFITLRNEGSGLVLF